MWIPFTGSKETIEWAGRHNFSAVLPDFKRGLTEDIVGYFAKRWRATATASRPEHLCFFTDAWVADDKAAALKEYGPYFLYFNQTLWHHGSTRTRKRAIKTARLRRSTSYDYVRPENRAVAGARPREDPADDDADIETAVDDRRARLRRRPRRSPTS